MNIKQQPQIKIIKKPIEKIKMPETKKKKEEKIEIKIDDETIIDLTYEKEEKQIGNYILQKEIGSGGFAKVFLAIHIPTNSKVAIKILNKILFKNDKINTIRFKKEVQILKKVKHANIARLYEVIETPSKIYLVMEYCPNGELLDYILNHRFLDEITARHFFQQYINALHYLHSQNICHRDIKPENLLLDRYKNIKLIDFGISTFYNKKNLLSSPCGTIIYAPPEMHLNNKYSGILSDIWNCGIVLYAMVCGYLPFCDENDDINVQNIVKGKYDIPDYLSPSLKDLITHLLEVDPMKRYDLEQIISHQWFNLKKNTLTNGIIVGVNKIPIDNAIVNKCLKIYPGKEDIIIKSIENNLFNEYSSTYYIFLNKLSNIGYESVSDLKSKKFYEFINNPENKIYIENNTRCNSCNNIKEKTKKKTRNYISPKKKLLTINNDYNQIIENRITPPLPHLNNSRNKKLSHIKHLSLNQSSIEEKFLKRKKVYQSFSPFDLIEKNKKTIKISTAKKKKKIHSCVFENNNILSKSYLNTSLEYNQKNQKNKTTKKDNNTSMDNNYESHTIITNRNASITIRNSYKKNQKNKIIRLNRKIGNNMIKNHQDSSSSINQSFINKQRHGSYSPNSIQIHKHNYLNEKKIQIKKKNIIKKPINVNTIRINRKYSNFLNDTLNQNSMNNTIIVQNHNNNNKKTIPKLNKGIIDISCIMAKSFNEIVQKITDTLNNYKISFIQINTYKFHCSKNGIVFEIKIYKIDFQKKSFLYYLAFSNKCGDFRGKLLCNAIKNCLI